MNDKLVTNFGTTLTVPIAKHSARAQCERLVSLARRRLAREALGEDLKAYQIIIRLEALETAFGATGLTHGWAWELRGWINDVVGIQRRINERFLEDLSRRFAKYAEAEA